jgi:hypothetical protein
MSTQQAASSARCSCAWVRAEPWPTTAAGEGGAALVCPLRHYGGSGRGEGASTDRDCRSHWRGGHAPAPRNEPAVALIRSEGQAQTMGGGLLAAAARGSAWSRSHHISGGVTYPRGEGRAAPVRGAPHEKLWMKQTRGPICSSRPSASSEGWPCPCSTRQGYRDTHQIKRPSADAGRHVS